MTTYTTKIAKNGNVLFYDAETGKRVKEADVVMDAIENGGTYYTAYVHGYNVDHICTKEFASPITAYKWICRMARKSTTYADGDAQIVVGFNGEEIYTQKMATAAIKNDELRAYMEAEEAPYVAESLRQERENQIVLQMSHRNITREQAEELVDYLSANRENYSDEVAATVKAMLDNFKKINNPEPAVEETAIVETVNAEEQSTNTESANENSKNNAELVNQLKTFNAKVRGLSCEEFLAENAGLPIAEYREQKAASENGIAKLEIKFKIEDIKSEIGRLESENYYTARKLYGIVVLEKHYATDESLQAYAAELVDEFNDLLGKINEAQAELATLAPATVEPANVEEPDGYNPDVFSLLPKREDLNDVDGEFDEDAAEYTDRDDRYNRGEKIAEGLTAKLRAFDPTVEVTFAIDDDEDTYYLSYDGISRMILPADGVEDTFHAMKRDKAKIAADPWFQARLNSPFDIARGLNDVFQKTLLRADAPYMDVITQDGAKIATTFGAAYISVDWRATDGYVFGNHYDDVLARYETPEQVTEVMTALRDAIEAGKTEFVFPSVDEIDPIDYEKFFAEHEANQPAEVKALNAELDASTLQAPHMWVRIVDGAGHHRGSFTRGLLSAVHVEYNAEPAAIKGYTLRYFDEPMRRYDTFAQVNAVVEQFKTAVISNADAFTFPTAAELTPPEPELSDREKFLKTKEYITTSPGRYLGVDKFGKDRFVTQWATLCPYKKINKATVSNILAAFGLTPETYLAEKAKWVAEEIKRGSRQLAIDMQAEFLRDKIDAERKASVEPMPALFPADDSDDDDELIDAPETKATVDEFTAKLAAFDAEITYAENARDAAKVAYEQAVADARNAVVARLKFVESIAGDLTRKLHATCVGNDFIETATTSGCPYTIGDISDIYVDATTNGRFVFVTWNNRPLAHYDTPVQVEAVIAKIKGVIERKDPVFHFPTVEELTAPPVAPAPPVAESVPVTEPAADFTATTTRLLNDWKLAVANYADLDYRARKDKSLRPAVKDAVDKATAASNALKSLGDAHLACLRPLLDQTIRAATLRIINEDGIDWGKQSLADISLTFRLTSADFAITANDNYYVTCKTPDEVTAVVDRLKAAVAANAAEFSFASKSVPPEPIEPEYRTYSPAFVDTVASVARICDTVNASAPRGWDLYYEVKTNRFIVEHNGRDVDRLTGVELYDALDAHPPEEFFDVYNPHPAVEFDDGGNITAIWF